MGFYFRKSLGFGPFRLNFSKSGVGVSTGVKGARIGIGPSGTYVHLGRNGFYYKKYISKENKGAPILPNENSNSIPADAPNTITTQNFEHLTDSESSEFIEELKSKNRKIRFLYIFGVFPSLALLGFLFYKCFEPIDINNTYTYYVKINSSDVNIRSKPSIESKVVLLSAREQKFKLLDSSIDNWLKILINSNDTAFVSKGFGDIGKELVGSEIKLRFDDAPQKRAYILGSCIFLLVFWNVFLNKRDKKRKSIYITYEFDEKFDSVYSNITTSFESLITSKKIWQIVQSQRTNDLKHHAGAGTQIIRKPIESTLDKLPTQFFKTNINIPSIQFTNTAFYFFPDKLLLKRNNDFAAISYKNLNIETSSSSFVEDEAVPADSIILEYTYQYVNKSGGPDKRFANNRRIPVCDYSKYSFSSSGGINELVMTSKKGALDNFISCLQIIKELEDEGNLHLSKENIG